MLATGILLALVIVAAVTDLRRGKIYNWTTYGGIATAMLLGALVSIAEQIFHMADASLWIVSSRPLDDALNGLLTCGGIMVPCFVVFHVGGGDVKLMAMLGTFLGAERGLDALLWTFVLAGGFTGCVLLLRTRPKTLLAQLRSLLVFPTNIRQLAPVSADANSTPLCLAPWAVLAIVLVHCPALRMVPP